MKPSMKRKILQQKIAQYEGASYELSLDAEAAAVQQGTDTTDTVEQLQKRSKNAQRAADRLKELLADLPTEDAEDAD